MMSTGSDFPPLFFQKIPARYRKYCFCEAALLTQLHIFSLFLISRLMMIHAFICLSITLCKTAPDILLERASVGDPITWEGDAVHVAR